MKFKIIKSAITYLMFLIGGVYLLLFMNCVTTDKPVTQSSFSGPDPNATQPVPYKYTNPNPSSGPPDPTPRPDPNNPDAPPSSNIVWLHTDVSQWAETSQISKVEIQQNGQVCIYHSKAGQWDAQSNVDSTITEPVEGNAWVIVPIGDKYYAATYDYLRDGQPCHTLDAENITNLYHSDKSLGKRTGEEPLDQWVPLAGDTIAFMVSGLARNDKRNIQERSDIIRVTLPSADGVDSTIVHPPCSEDPTGPLCSIESCHVPNRGSIIRDIAKDYPEPFEKAYRFYLDWLDEPRSQTSDDPRWEFLDKVVQRLHRTDDHWGYTCVRGDCDDVSTGAIAYSCGGSVDSISSHRISRNVNSTTTTANTLPHDVTSVDIINADDGSAQFLVEREVSQEDAPGQKYPRTDTVPNYYPDSVLESDVSDFAWSKVNWLNSHNVGGWAETSQISSVAVKQNGEICIDHSKAGQWCPIPGSEINSSWKPDPLEGNPYIVVKINDQYYAATYDWLRPGQTCKFGHVGSLGVIYSDPEDSLGRHTKRSPLQEWVPKSGEIVGFMVSGLARNNADPNNRERSNIVWYRMPSLDGSVQGGQVGSFNGGGATSVTGGTCPALASAGQCPPLPNYLGIVKMIAEKKGNLYKENPDEFTRLVADCLKDKDPNFGRYKNSATSGSISDDALGYRYEGASPCKVDIIVGANGPNPKIGWNPEYYPSNTWVAASGQCIIENIESVGKCTDEQLNDGFETDDGVCLPMCVRLSFYGGDPPQKLTGLNFDPESEDKVYDLYGEDILRDIEMGLGELCADDKKTDYNILKIDRSVISSSMSDVCCRRSSKTECPSPHYESRTISGKTNCYPSCGAAAELAGYSGPQSHVYLSNLTGNVECEDSDERGYSDWKDLPTFYDPYRFDKEADKTKLFLDEGNGVHNERGRCCVRGQPTHIPAVPHNDKGTYTTTTASTTTTPSSTDTSSSTVTTRARQAVPRAEPSGNDLCPMGCSIGQECQGGQCIDVGP